MYYKSSKKQTHTQGNVRIEQFRYFRENTDVQIVWVVKE